MNEAYRVERTRSLKPGEFPQVTYHVENWVTALQQIGR